MGFRLFRLRVLPTEMSLGGMAGSVLDVFGGEFEWDRYTVKFHKARGADHNVHIIYGKNLTDFKMEKSMESLMRTMRSLPIMEKVARTTAP